MCFWIRFLLEMQSTCVHLCLTRFVCNVGIAISHYYWLKQSCTPHLCEGTTSSCIKSVVFHHSAFLRRDPCVNESTQLNKCRIRSLWVSLLAKQVNITDAKAVISLPIKQQVVPLKVRYCEEPAGPEMIIICVLSAWTAQTADHRWLIGGNHTEILSKRCVLQIL